MTKTKTYWSIAALALGLILGTLLGNNMNVQAAETNPTEYVGQGTIPMIQKGDKVTYSDIAPLEYLMFSGYGLDDVIGGKNVYDVIEEGLRNVETSIDIRAYQLTPDELHSVFSRIINTSPEFFYMKRSYRYYSDGTYITRFIPQYENTSEIPAMKAFYNETLNHILSQADSSWTELEKILYVHDYVAQNYEYDTSYEIADAYRFFKEGKGVCQTYTMVSIALLEKLNVEVDIAISDRMNHIWNLVNVTASGITWM